MTSSSTTKNEDEPSSGKSKTNEDNQSKKIVIRRLPPSLTRDQFLDIVSPLPDYDFFYYCNADATLEPNSFCRAYICFVNFQDVLNFKDRFDNYVFVDAKSNEYPAIVELAPYQRRYNLKELESQKKDSKCNTIEQDGDYAKFLENFDKPAAESLPTCEAILEELEQKEKEKIAVGLSGSQVAFSAPKITTPLLEFMKKRREDKKSSRDKDRDRDRDSKSHRRDRDRDRDRDDDKRHGGYGKRRDEYYYGGKNQSESKSEIKILSKSSSQHSSSTNTAKNTGVESTSKSNQATKENSKSSNQTNYSANSKGGNYCGNSKKNTTDTTAESKNSGQSKSQSGTGASSSDSKPSKDSSKDDKRNNDKIRNKDRPAMQIYNPAQRAAQRQQKQQPQ